MSEMATHIQMGGLVLAAYKRSFYEIELSSTSERGDGVYKIEQVLKARGCGNNEESLFKWFL